MAGCVQLIIIRGCYEIPAAVAEAAPHDRFTFDPNGRITEIINYHPEQWKQHPLTHLSVYRVHIDYIGNKEIRTFYDRQNRRVPNLRKVYKEVFTCDSFGFRTMLEFYDLTDQPMESDWNISKYIWEKKGDWVIERRFNRSGILVPLSPYFNFGITGIQYDAEGYPSAHYNLNENLEVVENYSGVASYRDTCDSKGNHLQYAYYNADNQLMNAYGFFAVGKKYYDANGNVVREEQISRFGDVVRVFNFKYDANGFMTN